MTALQREYKSLRLKYPESVIWFVANNYVQSISDCAIITSDVLGTVLTKRPDDAYPYTGFPLTLLRENSEKMINCGYKVAVIDTSF